MDETRESKAEWLMKIERGRQTWEEIVSNVDEAWFDRPGAMGDWTFKDVAAHLNAWRDLTVARLESATGDKSAPPMPWPDGMSEETDEGTEEINQWFYARDRDKPMAEILAKTSDQFQRIRTALEAIPESELETRYPWFYDLPISNVLKGTLEHLYVEHETTLRAWIAEQSRGR
jgi:hypothetical protein